MRYGIEFFAGHAIIKLRVKLTEAYATDFSKLYPKAQMHQSHSLKPNVYLLELVLRSDEFSSFQADLLQYRKLSQMALIAESMGAEFILKHTLESEPELQEEEWDDLPF